jgi:hypothetical protein
MVQTEGGGDHRWPTAKHILNALVNLYTQSTQSTQSQVRVAGEWHLKRTATLLDVRSISITIWRPHQHPVVVVVVVVVVQ